MDTLDENQILNLKKLRVEFETSQIGVLCKVSSTNKNNTKQNCKKCGGYHATPAFAMNYVGHANTRNRLLDADLGWSWKPLALDSRGLPALDDNGGLWITLTVCGVTKLGYGHAVNETYKNPGDLMKEIIGDAIRNAAMSFGVALHLWSKNELISLDEDVPEVKSGKANNPAQELVKPVEILKPMPDDFFDQVMTHFKSDIMNGTKNIDWLKAQAAKRTFTVTPEQAESFDRVRQVNQSN